MTSRPKTARHTAFGVEGESACRFIRPTMAYRRGKRGRVPIRVDSRGPIIGWACVVRVCGVALPLLLPGPASARDWPSVFRGVVVADSPLGVRVLSVEDGSQASLIDLRPEDIIVQIDGREVRSIDDFATISAALKGRSATATILIFRNGTPQEITLHLYSVPVLQTWGVAFIPEHDIRFAQAQAGVEYWLRLGKGYEEAGRPAEALEAYLNSLHNMPTDTTAAFLVERLSLQLASRLLREGALPKAVDVLQQAVLIMERLFSRSLTEAQLQLIRKELAETLQALRHAIAASPQSTSGRIRRRLASTRHRGSGMLEKPEKELVEPLSSH